MDLVPVIAIDGPSASGKGTVAERVARALGFHYLDSGALYRAAALAATRANVPLDDADRVAEIASRMGIRFTDGRIWLGGMEVTDALRSEACGQGASQVAALPRVRRALLEFQRAQRRRPGLVADGRDMGSVVFPDATLKVFLTAAPLVRAQRRYNQLMEKGIDASIPLLLKDIEERDARDANRAAAPLKQSVDASLLDTTSLSVDEAVKDVLRRYEAVSRR